MAPPFTRFLYWFSIAATTLAVAAGCSARHYRKSADKDASQILTNRAPSIPNMERNFQVEQKPALSIEALSDLPLVNAPADFLGAQSDYERGARILPLIRTLEIGVDQSRTYQLRKEQLYLAALDLTFARSRFRPLFRSSVRGEYQTTTEEVRVAIDAITGQPRAILDQDARLVEQNRVSANGGVNMSWLLASGAQLTTFFASDFLRFLTGDPRVFSQSQAGAAISQPLLRGAGYKVTLENLTQSERNLLYAMRDFAQFRREFSVTLATDYFNVLRNRDQVRNAWLDLARSRENARREKAFAEQGQRPLASLDQLRQAELNSETRWLAAVRDYRESLDRLKIQLGLPIEFPIVLDDQELARLRIEDPGIPVDEAVRVALAVRLDLQNTLDQVTDANRRIGIARNRLLPQIDAVAGARISDNATRGFPIPDPNRYQWNAGLDVNLPFDRKAERNDYRRSIITLARAERDYTLAVDRIKLELASDGRALDQARRNFENAEISVRLSERRVEEQELRMQLGRGATRDLLDAQSDLINAQNARTAALITHTIARLRYWQDMGILYLDDSGRWKDIPTRPDAAAPPPPQSTPPSAALPPNASRLTAPARPERN